VREGEPDNLKILAQPSLSLQPKQRKLSNPAKAGLEKAGDISNLPEAGAISRRCR